MSQQFTPAVSMRTLVQALTASGQFLDALTWRLFTNQISPTPATAIGDFTEAVFDGYSPSVGTTWGTPWSDVAGSGYVTGENAQYHCTGSTTPQNVYGYFVTKGSSVSETLQFYEQWNDFVPIAESGDAVIFPKQYGLPGPITAAPQGP
jgi:hypothetical protein